MTDVDEIKSRLNIVDIIGERVTLKKAGRNFKALCPFHNEKTPSFIVSPDRQTFHCFGCGKGGSIFDFVMLLDHIDFPEALETLAERAGVKLERRASDTPEGKLRQSIMEANHLASEYYHYLLTKHAVGDNARLYIKTRGISDKSVKTFMMGYSANTWDGLLKYLTKKGYDGRLLEQAGLVIRGNRGYYDRFRGRVMFALCNHRGNVIGFSGRVLDPTAKEAKYINSPETPVYTKGKTLYALHVTKDAIQKENAAILMEGELDVISSFQAGIPNVVAIKGSAVTEDHARLLKRFTDRLVFALDSDMAGDAAARRGIDIAEKNGFDMRVSSMPSGKDPDEAARENPGLLKKALKDAIPIYDYFIASAEKRFDKTSAYGKRKISDELLPALSRIDNPVVQGHYVRKLATVLGVSEESVRDSIARKKTKAGGWSPRAEQPAGEPAKTLSRLEKAELYALALTLQGATAELMESFGKDIRTDDLSYLPVRRIFEHLKAFTAEHRIFLAKDFADSLPSELTPVFDEAFLTDITEILDDGERFSREWDKVIREMKRLQIRHRMESVSGRLRNDAAGQEDHDGIQAELKRLTDDLSALEKNG